MLKINNSTITPTIYETLLNDAFNLVKKNVIKIADKADLYDKIGRRDLSIKEFRRGNDYQYVIWYFTIIKMWQLSEIAKGNTVTYNDIEAKYGIECIKSTLACRGVAILSLIDLFGFNSTLLDGINYMDISVGSNVFQIQ